MITLLKSVDTALNPVRKWADHVSCLVTLSARLYMANIFFKSGLLKWGDIANGRFEDVVLYFSDIHPVPGLNPEFAAAAGTAGELILPVLLALGLFGRVGALGLLIMTLVIQFAVPAEYGVANPEHYVWMMLLAVPLFHGMGRISIDYWLVKWLRRA